MAVVFSTDTDDDGSGTTGTIHNDAWKQAMAAAINTGVPMLSGGTRLAPAQITANQSNYSPTGLSTASTVTLDSDAAYYIEGLGTGVEGRFLVLHNQGNFTLTLKHEAAGATATNRFFFVGVSDFLLTANMALPIYYTNARWRRFGA